MVDALKTLCRTYIQDLLHTTQQIDRRAAAAMPEIQDRIKDYMRRIAVVTNYIDMPGATNAGTIMTTYTDKNFTGSKLDELTEYERKYLFEELRSEYGMSVNDGIHLIETMNLHYDGFIDYKTMDRLLDEQLKDYDGIVRGLTCLYYSNGIEGRAPGRSGSCRRWVSAPVHW